MSHGAGAQEREHPSPALESATEPRFVVVIPTYNHGRTVVDVVARTSELHFNMIVVDDGSTDHTAAALVEFTSANPTPRIDVLTHKKNMGKAAALRSGFARAAEQGATHVVTIDADGQLDPEEIPALVAEARAHPTALILGRRPERMIACPTRCLIGRRYASLAVLAQTGLRLADTQCGLRVYPLGGLERAGCHATRYAFEAEVITRMAWRGHKIREVPVRCRYFEGAERVSHWKPWRDSMRQALVHVRLVALALLPWTRSAGGDGSGGGARLRRFIAWLNPLRSWREVRDGGIGDLELASGLAIGALIGSSPFYGLHTLVSVYVAWRLHQHPAAVVLGSQVSLPPFGVLLAAASIWLGHLILTGDPGHFGPVELSWESLWKIPLQRFVEWMLGSLVLGPIVAAGAFLIGLVVGRRARRTVQVVGAR